MKGITFLAVVLVWSEVVMGQTLATSDKRIRHDGQTIVFDNRLVLVRLHEPSGTCDISWRAKNEPTITDARFSAEIDGSVVRLRQPKTETKSINDKLGSGIEFTQSQGEEVKIRRVVRVYE